MSCALVAYTAGCLSSSRADSVNLIQNGSFEGPTVSILGVRSYDSPPTGWTAPVGYGVQIYNDSAGSYLPIASQGKQLYYLGDYGQHAALQQNVALQAGHSYELTFDLAPLIRTPGLDRIFAYSDAVVDLTISSADETLLGGLTYDYVVPAAAQAWRTQVFEFTAQYDQSYSFLFTTRGENGGYIDAAFIDNVRLTDRAAAPQSVPDGGSSLGYLMLPVIGLVCFRRRYVA